MSTEDLLKLIGQLLKIISPKVEDKIIQEKIDAIISLLETGADPDRVMIELNRLIAQVDDLV